MIAERDLDLVSEPVNLDEPILGLGREWPQKLYYLQVKGDTKVACYCYSNVHGVALFSDPSSAVVFAGFLLAEKPCELVNISYESAIKMAKEKPMPIVSIMLLDDIEDPLIQFVK